MFRLLIVCCAVSNFCCGQSSEDGATSPLGNQGRKEVRNINQAPDDVCRSFVHIPNSLTLRGEMVRKVGDGYTASECRQACLSTTDFFCAAAQIQLSSTCFVTGYRMRSDYFSVHYARNCDHGPSCFQQANGVSTGFKESVAIPRQFAPDVQALYCMASCELIGSSCVGFDLRTDGNKPRCVITNLGVFPSDSFDLYIRRC